MNAGQILYEKPRASVSFRWNPRELKQYAPLALSCFLSQTSLTLHFSLLHSLMLRNTPKYILQGTQFQWKLGNLRNLKLLKYIIDFSVIFHKTTFSTILMVSFIPLENDLSVWIDIIAWLSVYLLEIRLTRWIAPLGCRFYNIPNCS